MLEKARHILDIVLLPVLNTFLPLIPVASVVEMVKTTWRPHKTCVSSREGVSSNRDGIGFSKHLLVVLRQSQSCGPRGSIVLVTLSKQCCHGTGRFSLSVWSLPEAGSGAPRGSISLYAVSSRSWPGESRRGHPISGLASVCAGAAGQDCLFCLAGFGGP